VETTTIEGVAHASYRLSSLGILEVRATSEPAVVSDVLQLDIKEGEAAVITAIAPTIAVTPTQGLNVDPTEIGSSPNTNEHIPGNNNFSNWFIAMVIVAISTFLNFQLGLRFINQLWGIRIGLTTLVGGQLCYVIILFTPVKGEVLLPLQHTFLIGLVCIGGSVLGGFGGWIWYKLNSKAAKIMPHQVSTKDGHEKADH
jgi:beta-N-acetylhexosaminidase